MKGNPAFFEEPHENLARLFKLREVASQHKDTSIHMPRIGCGLAGGDWEIVEDMIETILKNIPVFVYDLYATNE